MEKSVDISQKETIKILEDHHHQHDYHPFQTKNSQREQKIKASEYYHQIEGSDPYKYINPKETEILLKIMNEEECSDEEKEEEDFTDSRKHIAVNLDKYNVAQRNTLGLVPYEKEEDNYVII